MLANSDALLQPKSPGGPELLDTLPDAFLDALGDAVRDVRQQGEREIERIAADARAALAEMKAENAELRRSLEMAAGDQAARVSAALSIVKDGSPGRDGKDAEPLDMALIEHMVADKVGQGIAAISAALLVPKDGRDGIDGKDAEPVSEHEIAVAVERYLATNPPAPGRDGDPGPAGKDAEPITKEQIVEAVLAAGDAIQDAVVKHLTANPPPAGRDGVDGKDGRPGERGIDGKDAEPVDYEGIHKFVVERIAEIPVPKDGRDGENGLRGEKGEPGRDGRDGLPGVPGAHGEKGIDGRDGKDGREGIDGKDGLGFDDLEFEYDGERKFALKFTRGEQSKRFEFSVPVVLDRGVWREGNYQKSDAVTFGGSAWIAQRDTSEKPDIGSKDWRLMVKKGRDGKDGVMRQIAPPGPVKLC